MEEVKITIIGAGVIGLAIAQELSKTYRDIVLLEKEKTFGQGISSRNSEVMHAGIYYPVNSLKAKLCVEGIDYLYAYCKENNILHSQIGKLIVASETCEIPALEKLLDQGKKNGAKNLEYLSKEEVKKIEPNVNAKAAFYSPFTGIIDTHSFMKQLYNQAMDRNVIVCFANEVNKIEFKKQSYHIGLVNQDYSFSSRVVINSAGLFSDCVAQLVGLDVEALGYKLSYYKGSYFSYLKPSPVKHLVYPLPHENLTGLGIHATLNLSNTLRFGPDAEYVDELDYNVEGNKKIDFYQRASKLINKLDHAAFSPDMAGIRPKLKGEIVRDFIISHEEDKGYNGFINLIGIESPGLTASLAIAKYVRNIVDKVLS